MVFKIKYSKQGGHIHCTLFAAKQLNMTYANCGTFCIREEELQDLEFAMSGVQFEDREREASSIPQESNERKSDASY